MSLITALATLNRMDTVLLFLPGLLYIVAKYWKVKNLLYVLYGFIPFILWEIFSIIYYGFPLPNTYYAKLNTGIPLGEYISQGISYYANLFNNDPMSAVVIFGGVIGISIYSIKQKTANIYLPLITGIILYLIYILRIGGDFMSGRFFAAPFLMVIALLCTIQINLKLIHRLYILSIIVLVFAIIRFITINNDQLSYYEMRHNENFDIDKYNEKVDKKWHGVLDERNFYYNDSGLLHLIRIGSSEPSIPEVENAKLSKKAFKLLLQRIMIGVFGYFSGPHIRIIDMVALTDPLLSKLKITCDTTFSNGWRIGHFLRKIPMGYVESIETGINQIEDFRLKKYYEKLKIITQSPIFNFDRFIEIWRFNTGYYNNLLHNDYKENDLPKLYAGDSVSVITYNLRMGNYYKERKMRKKAIHFYKKLIDEGENILKPKAGSYSFYNVGRLYFELNKLDSALLYTREGLKYIRLKENMIYQLNLLSDILVAKNEISEAIEVLKKILEIDSENVAALNNLAVHSYQIGKHNEAISAWKKVILLNPGTYQSYRNLYITYYNKMIYDSAAYYAFKTIEKGGKVDAKILEELKKYRK